MRKHQKSCGHQPVEALRTCAHVKFQFDMRRVRQTLCAWTSKQALKYFMQQILGATHDQAWPKTPASHFTKPQGEKKAEIATSHLSASDRERQRDLF